jgi:hypothetical protein
MDDITAELKDGIGIDEFIHTGPEFSDSASQSGKMSTC